MRPASIKALVSCHLLLSCLLSGCASLDADPAFDAVQRDVAERTGLDVRWRTGGDADQAVAERIRHMLHDELSLDQAVQIALLNNPRLQSVYERIGIAQANLVQAGLLKNPIFHAEVKLVDNVPGTKAIVEMAVVQDFMDVLMVPLRKRLARAQLRAMQARATGEVLDLASETRIRYVSLLAARESYQMRKQVLQATEAEYDAGRRLHQAGNITDLALTRHRNLYEQAKLDVSAAETRMLEAREEMNVLMGLWGPEIQWRARGKLPEIPEEPMDLEDISRQALANSVDLTILRDEMRIVAAETGIDAAQLVFPELGAGAAAEYEGPEDKWLAGPAIAMGLPIFDWGQARTAAGRHRLRSLWRRYTDLAIRIRSRTRAAGYRLSNARRQGEHYRRVMLPLAEQITAETQLRYNAMQVGVFHLLEAKRREISTRRLYILAVRDYWIARTELEQLLTGRMLRDSAMPAQAGPPAMGGDDGGH
jgi:cobalt-zinc-cadmium efflux system outer membrane protein